MSLALTRAMASMMERHVLPALGTPPVAAAPAPHHYHEQQRCPVSPQANGTTALGAQPFAGQFDGPSISNGIPSSGVRLSAENQRLLNAGLDIPFNQTPQGQALHTLEHGGPLTSIGIFTDSLAHGAPTTESIKHMEEGTSVFDEVFGMNMGPAADTGTAKPLGCGRIIHTLQ